MARGRHMNEYGVSWSPGILPAVEFLGIQLDTLWVVAVLVVVAVFAIGGGIAAAHVERRRIQEKYHRLLMEDAASRAMPRSLRAVAESQGNVADVARIAAPSLQHAPCTSSDAAPATNGSKQGASPATLQQTDATVATWLATSTVKKPGNKLQAKVAYVHYATACDRSSVIALSKPAWCAMMDKLVEFSSDAGRRKFYHGFALNGQLMVVRK